MNVASPTAILDRQTTGRSLPDDEVPFVINLPGGVRRLCLLVENVHCSGCIRKIEDTLHATPGVLRARVNLSTRRLVLEWRQDEVAPGRLMDTVAGLGFPVAPFDSEALGSSDARNEKILLRALAVAGFAAGNVMLLSVSVWAGHDGGMGLATRDFFHWVSALIALPAVAYAGQPFFRSAAAAIKARRFNMDMPISLAVILASAVSLYQTVAGGQHAYFDASVSLLFFLLIGRYLDQRARTQARSAAAHLMGLAARAADVAMPDGTTRRVPVDELRPGMTVLVAAGERIPTDGVVSQGSTSVDTSLITGEALPSEIGTGAPVFAGTINLAAPVRISVTAAGEGTLLAEIVRLMEAAEQGRARYVRIADRVARFYSPAVHILAAVTFAGWLSAGAGWESALLTAVAVLIITCPCALGLAVPAVQVVASGLLLKHGVLLKSADGLERLAAVDVAVFDKTGTLTEGRPFLTNASDIRPDDMALAVALARCSRHPLCRALVEAAGSLVDVALEDAAETPGRGVSASLSGKSLHLGNATWLGIDPADDADTASEIWLQREARPPVRFRFEDALRADARDAVQALRELGIEVRLLSGDRPAAVAAVARQLGIDSAEARCLPADKVARIRALAKDGHKVLMVGDGLNDAPALAAGFASMSPATAVDISRTAANVVYQGNGLMAVPNTVRAARFADALVRQNFVLAFVYNALAVPFAIAGLATPLFAAVAMSASSLLVTGNALRMRLMTWRAAR